MAGNVPNGAPRFEASRAAGVPGAAGTPRRRSHRPRTDVATRPRRFPDRAAVREGRDSLPRPRNRAARRAITTSTSLACHAAVPRNHASSSTSQSPFFPDPLRRASCVRSGRLCHIRGASTESQSQTRQSLFQDRDWRQLGLSLLLSINVDFAGRFKCIVSG